MMIQHYPKAVSLPTFSERKSRPQLPVTSRIPEPKTPKTEEGEFDSGDSGEYKTFEVDDRIRLVVDFDLAARLGQLIVNTETQDEELLAFAHRLNDITRDDDEE